MRPNCCVIFNPTARGEKAAKFRSHLGELDGCTFLPTTGPGAARALGLRAVEQGFQKIVAAGGDGTVNEVLNGIADAPEGLKRVAFGVIPLGTINVFARELKIPVRLPAAWEVVNAGRERLIDLPEAVFRGTQSSEKRCFAQLAGAGLDSRAVASVSWELKKRIGPLAYVWAGIKALSGPQSAIRVETDAGDATGDLVIIGNGKLYGGNFEICPGAEYCDGLLDVCVFQQVNWRKLPRHGWSVLTDRLASAPGLVHLQAPRIRLSSSGNVALQLDGELTGHLPAEIVLRPERLRVLVP